MESQWCEGFFNDDFNGAAIHPGLDNICWHWSISSGALIQTDETNSNTNIYAAVTQSLSNRYLYCFKGTITGANTSHRAEFILHAIIHPNSKEIVI